ncbi:MAG TPA: VOC family protein [Mycobacteriales bacterium]|nr:VOC family protein [Mycobacteriales bacterium]
MHIIGLSFAGTSTPQREQMTEFMVSVLGVERAEITGVEADLFCLADGSLFAVAAPDTMGPSARAIGFLVDDLDAAISDLRDHGIYTDEIVTNDLNRYVHFTAPDGHLYELVEPC